MVIVLFDPPNSPERWAGIHSILQVKNGKSQRYLEAVKRDVSSCPWLPPFCSLHSSPTILFPRPYIGL